MLYLRFFPFVVKIIQLIPHAWRITGFVTIVTRRVSLVEQKLFISSEHMSSSPVFSGVHVAQSLVFYVMLSRSLFVLVSFYHCIIYPSSIYGFSLCMYYCWYPINRFNIAIYSCLSKARIWISNVICRGLILVLSEL